MKKLFVVLLILPSVVFAETLTLSSGDNLQSALNNADPGDTIILEAGATFVGPITLPRKTGDQYITIRSSRTADLPNGRVSPAHASLMAKIVSAGSGEPAIQTALGAHHYKLVGIEVAPQNSSVFSYGLVHLGYGDDQQRSLSDVPHHFVLDRMYIHTTQPIKRGIALNSADTDITNSYISGFKSEGQDSQAICGWNGPGPFRIINNFLDGASENVMFGGATPGISGLIPSNIEIRQNHFYKPTSLKGRGFAVKNLLEFKNAKNVVVEGNYFQNNWAEGQSGTAILFTPRGEDGAAPWSIVQNIQFTNNVIDNTVGVFAILGRDYPTTSGNTNNIVIRNNLAINFTGWFVLFTGDGATDITIENNTALQTNNVASALAEGRHQRVTIRNNIQRQGLYGYHPCRDFMSSLGRPIFTGNVFLLDKTPNDYNPVDCYPSGQSFPETLSEIGFVDPEANNFRHKSNSRYLGKGANIDLIESALGGAIITNPSTPAVAIAAPSRLSVARYARGNKWLLSFAWRDNSRNEEGFVIESITRNGAKVLRKARRNVTRLSTTVSRGAYRFRVRAYRGALKSRASNEVRIRP